MLRKDNPAARSTFCLLHLRLPGFRPRLQCSRIGEQIERVWLEVLAKLGPPLVMERGGADDEGGEVGDSACLSWESLLR